MTTKLERIRAVAQQLGWGKRLENLQFPVVGPLKEVVLFGTEGLDGEKDFQALYPRYPEISAEMTMRIDQKWAELNSPFPSKPIAAIQSIQVKEGALFIQTRPAGFHHYIGTKTSEPRRLKNLDGLTTDFFMPVSFGGICVTEDNWIPVGLRASHLAIGKNKVSPLPDGFFDPVNEAVQIGPIGKKKPFPSLLVFVACELWEEMRIGWYDRSTILGMVHEDLESQQPQIQVRINLPFTKKEVSEKLAMMLREEGRESEISWYDFIRNDIQSVREYPGIWSNHAAAKLMLHFALV